MALNVRPLGDERFAKMSAIRRHCKYHQGRKVNDSTYTKSLVILVNIENLH